MLGRRCAETCILVRCQVCREKRWEREELLMGAVEGGRIELFYISKW